MKIIREIADVRAFVKEVRMAGETLAFVPTMGCLHSGHLGLVALAKTKTQRVLVSIFVNPTQFGPNEDFDKYPRTEPLDLAACEAAGVDAVFLPAATTMFPINFSTWVNEETCSTGLCGDFRPGHFRGVTTVVLQLFNIVTPDVAIFGQKDAQQAAVLRKMARDLFLPIEIVIAPIAREADGLALSSRNRYLAPEQRAIAPQLHAALLAGKTAARATNAITETVTATVQAHLAKFPQFQLQYVSLVNADTMRPLAMPADAPENRRLLAAAAYLGTTRLLDNEVF